jgi:hypothetical protein
MGVVQAQIQTVEEIYGLIWAAVSVAPSEGAKMAAPKWGHGAIWQWQ